MVWNHLRNGILQHWICLLDDGCDLGSNGGSSNCARVRGVSFSAVGGSGSRGDKAAWFFFEAADVSGGGSVSDAAGVFDAAGVETQIWSKRATMYIRVE